MQPTMQAVWKFVQTLSSYMKLFGAFLLVVMAALTCVDVVGRFFRHPVFGSVELMSLMGAMAVAMALPDTHANKGHIGVEIVFNKLGRKSRQVMDIATGILTLILFSLVTWQMFEYSYKMMESGEVSMNLGLPEYLIIGVVAFGFVVFSVVIIRQLVEAFHT